MNTGANTIGKENEKKKGGFFKIFFITFLIALGIRFFIAQPFIVNGDSMLPSFESGDYLIVDELSYNFRDPSRGEVIIFRFPQNPSKFFIKRIIGLPGERVEIKGNDILVATDGNKNVLSEPYVKDIFLDPLTINLKDNEYFVMGDNRGVSSDSRNWGPVDEGLIVGRALVRFLPITEAGVLPGNYIFSE